MEPTLQQEMTSLEILSSTDTQESVVAPVELGAFFDTTLVNDNLVRMFVKAFGWEVNRNNFLFNQIALKQVAVDALGNEIPAWKSFENQLVNANHLMKDNGNSKVDRVIGFIEDAELRQDGVYLTLIVWKRTLSEDELAQLRDQTVSVSMEVTYTQPRVLVDGQLYPPSSVKFDPRNTVRTMADDSTLSFVGIAVLFDNIKPGFGSQEVLVTENAMVESGALVSEDTHTEVSMDQKELEAAVNAAVQAKETEHAAALDAKNGELAAANEALAAKQLELQKLFDELDALRQQAFNETVASCFDLGKLTASTAAWLLDMIRWSGSIEETAAKLSEISGACKAPAALEVAAVAAVVPEAEVAAAGAPCADGKCGECAVCKTDPADASKAGDASIATNNQNDAADQLDVAPAAIPGNLPGTPGPDKVIPNDEISALETAAAATAGADAFVNIAGKGAVTPIYGHRHL